MNMRKIRMIVTSVLAVILVASLTVAFAAGGFQAVVTSDVMRVYEQTAPYAYMGTLAKGAEVTVLDYNSSAALIQFDGKTAIAHISDLAAVGSQNETSVTANSSADNASTEYATEQELANARKAVTKQTTRIYEHKTTSSRYATVDAGFTLNLVEVDGDVAKVEHGGIIGYMPASHLAEQSEQKEESEVVQYDHVPVVTTTATRVYSKASTTSTSIRVEKDTKMELLATKGNCAMVERNGKVGYIDKNTITLDLSADVEEVTLSDNKSESVTSESVFTGTNEHIVYRFLTSVMGYNTAAACGVMANIKYESDYKPSTTGDSSSSYGIIQWHAARKTRLINWCQNNGYDYTTLKGQLYYMQYELKTYYPAVHNQLMAVSNSDQGAYEAGYYFCYNYEAPSNRASRAVTRGNYAKTTLWMQYKV